MKRIKYIFSFLLVFTLIFSACKKEFLDIKPSHAIDSETALKDSAKLEAFMTGMYDINQYWYHQNYIIMNNDVRGGDVIVRNYSNYGRFLEDYQFNLITTYYVPRRVWRYTYKMIAAANLVIAAVPDSDFDADFKSQIVAEARALRALAYYNLMRQWCHPYSVDPNGLGVPVLEQVIGPDDEFPARNTVGEVYDLMLADLTFADQNLTDRNDAHGVFRMTPNTVDGLLARINLHMGNWAEASTHAVAARNGYPLAPAGDLANGFVDPTSEWIFAFDNTADDYQGYLHVASFYDPFDAGYSSFKASQDFVGLYEGGDARLAYFGALEQPANAYRVTKFLFRSSWDLDQLLMRSAEMYLIEAEAQAELGNSGVAITALNAVQTRANATLTAGLSGQALIDAVLVERRKELFGEGFASYDLQRRNLPLNRTGVGNWEAINLPANDNRFLYPIPQEEMDANDNMQQNGGY